MYVCKLFLLRQVKITMSWRRQLVALLLLLYYGIYGGNAEECVDENPVCEAATRQYGCATYWPTYPGGGTFVGYACRKTCGLCSFPMTGPNYNVQNNALKELYYSTNGRGWVDKSSWLDDTVGHCKWYGVYCDSSGNITAL